MFGVILSDNIYIFITPSNAKSELLIKKITPQKNPKLVTRSKSIQIISKIKSMQIIKKIPFLTPKDESVILVWLVSSVKRNGLR